MGFFNRLTLVVCFILYSLIAQVSAYLSGIASFGIALAFWIVFFWWFDSNYVLKQEPKKEEDQSDN